MEVLVDMGMFELLSALSISAVARKIYTIAPKVAIPANADSSSIANFTLFIQNTDPGSNAGIPGIQVPVALGASTKLPVGLELDAQNRLFTIFARPTVFCLDAWRAFMMAARDRAAERVDFLPRTSSLWDDA